MNIQKYIISIFIMTLFMCVSVVKNDAEAVQRIIGSSVKMSSVSKVCNEV